MIPSVVHHHPPVNLPELLYVAGTAVDSFGRPAAHVGGGFSLLLLFPGSIV